MTLTRRLRHYLIQRKLRRDLNEAHELIYLRPLLQGLPDSLRIALDVGANIGNVTLALTDMGFKVYACEPHPATRQKLRNNLNDLVVAGKVVILDVAASNYDGVAEMFVGAADTLNTLEPDWTTVAFPEYFREKQTISIHVRKLMTIRREQRIAQLGFLKIDTEGHEVKVLQGLFAEPDFESPAMIMFEANQRFPKQAEECLRLLSINGYRCFDTFIKEGRTLLTHIRFMHPQLPPDWYRFGQAYFYANTIAYHHTFLEARELPNFRVRGKSR